MISVNYFKQLIHLIYFLFIFISDLEASVPRDSIRPRSNIHSWFTFNAGYRLPVNKNTIINSGHGLYLEGGINPGHLISEKTLLSIYAGFAFQDKFYATGFNRDFAIDYKEAIRAENFSGLDSSVIYSSADLFKNSKGTASVLPGCATNSFHNYSMYYGIQFNLPFKFSPIVKIYKGTTRTYFQGEGTIATKEKDFNIFELRRQMYGTELFLTLKNIKSKDHLLRKIGLSLYGEYCDFYRSSLYFYDGSSRKNLKLCSFTTKSFRDKYRSEFYYGAKLSLFIF